MPMGAGAGVFLSYRRDDTAVDAHRIYRWLARRFGDELVFLDIEDIPLGVDFVDSIERALQNAAYVLIAIGPRWLLVTDANNRRRLDDPEDLVRMEVRTALEGKKLVVPVLIGGAVMPNRRDLPADIAPLVRRNGIAIRPDPDFEADVEALMEGLRPDRILQARVPTVFRVGLVARNLGLGGGIGWGTAGLLLGLLADTAQLLFALPVLGFAAGMTGGSFVGWLTALLIRHRSPPLVGRKLVRMGLTWSLSLIGSIVLAGTIGFFVARSGVDVPPPDTSGLAPLDAIVTSIAGAFFGALVAVLLMAIVIVLIALVGAMTGSVLAAAFFARQFRMRSDQISRGRAFVIAIVWLIGGLLTIALFIAGLALLPGA